MKKYLLLTCLIILSLAGFLTYQYLSFSDGKLHVIFCNVGQGDGILIRTPSQKYIMLDAGPDKSIIDCLGKHMPVWQRDIDLALLSHPHSDHFMGYYYVKDRYTIHAFATERLTNPVQSFQMLMSIMQEEHIPQRFVLTGDDWDLGDGVAITIEGPTQDFLDRTSPNGKIGENKEFASLITKVSYGSFSVLLTGDTQAEQLGQAADAIGEPVTVLQAPHHGSATGLTLDLLKQLDPKVAVISVGKNNYGHPTLATLQLLMVPGITLKRTDRDGDVEIVSDGNEWRL